MQPDTPKLIESIRAALTRDIAPQVTSQRHAELLALIDLALRELRDRARSRRDLLLEDYRRRVALLDQGLRLLALADPQTQATLQSTPVTSLERIQREPTWEAVERAAGSLQSLLARVAGAVVDQLPVQDSDGWSASARNWLSDVIHAEAECSAQKIVDDSVSAAPGNPPVPSADTEKPLRAHWSGKAAFAGTLTDFTVDTLSGGFSRDTLLVTVESTEGGRSERIVRKENAGGLMKGVALSLRDEYSVVRFASEQSLRVPRQLWLEEDVSWIGGAFAVMEKVAGATLGSGLAASRVTPAALRDVAQVLARVHSTPALKNAEIRRALRYPTNRDLSVPEAFRMTLARWESYAREAGVSPSPSVAAVWRWLNANIPERQIEPCLLHGDVGFHNMIFIGDRVSALLDWELADLGDPARDLAMIRRPIQAHLSWPEFMQWYEEAGGAPVDEPTLRYYELFVAAISVITMRVALESQFGSASPPDIKYLQFGLAYLPYFDRQLAQAAAVMGAVS